MLFSVAKVLRSFSPLSSSITKSDLNFDEKFLLCLDMFKTTFVLIISIIADSLISCPNSVLIYGTIIVLIVMTFSRTASIGIMVVILMMTFHYNLNKKVQLFILFFIGMYIFSSYYLTNDYFAAMIDDRLSSMDINEIFNNSHVSVLLAAFSIYFSSILIFLFGTGYNCLHIYYTLFTQFPDFKAHSYFVQTLVELGIPGLIICLSLFVILFKIISSGNKYPALRQKCFLMRCILISGFIMNCTYDSFNQPSLFIVLALFMVFSTEVKIETNNFLIESKKD
jgi:O-antigen ligase